MGLSTYDSQVIINLLTGTTDGAIASGTAALHKKFKQDAKTNGYPAQIVTLKLSDKVALLNGGESATDELGQTVSLAQAIVGITSDTRLYIRGHGDWQTQTVAGWTRPEVAQLLAVRGLIAGTLINVTACNAGKDSNASGTTRVTSSMDSFAAQLHRSLKTPHNLECMVTARVFYVTVADP
jgi:hypothetical protein